MMQRILDEIKKGAAEYPVLSRRIEERLHISGPQVRDAVRYYRRRGEPIIATEAGYYIATTPEEVDIVINDLTARASSMFKTIAALRAKKTERFGEQPTFTFQSGPGGDVQSANAGGAAPVCGPSETESSGGEVLHVQADHREEKPGDIRQGSADGAFDAVLLSELIG